jgi:hypothetical protein
LNSTCDEFEGSQLFHPEIGLWIRAMDNVIVYGLKGTRYIAQGLFVQPTEPVAGAVMSNFAFVDIGLLANDPTGNGMTGTSSAGGYFSQLQGVQSNGLYWKIDTQNGVVLFPPAGQDQFRAQDVCFNGVIFHPKQNLKALAATPGVTLAGCSNGTSAKLAWIGLPRPATKP